MQTITTAQQIGNLLTSRRKERGLTQAEVAARVGLSQNRLSVLEKNAATLTALQLLALLNELGFDLAVKERAAGAGTAAAR